MKAFKRIGFGIIALSVLTTIGMGSYNSMLMSDDTFMADSSGISFTKRLDEINGQVIIGRMAASSIPWKKVQRKKNKVKKKLVKARKALAKGNIKKAKRKMKGAARKLSKMAPAINSDLDLDLSNVFYKKPLKKGSFSGSAKTVDGVIEEIYVSMPGGRVIEINTRERMSGNVFQYEDSETREMKSGMFYEVKKGTYMVTLTNDSQFPGTRLEFKAGEAEVAYSDDHYTAQESWDLDEQNKEEQTEYSNNNVEQIVPEVRYDDIERENQERFEREKRKNEFVRNEYETNESQTDFNFQS